MGTLYHPRTTPRLVAAALALTLGTAGAACVDHDRARAPFTPDVATPHDAAGDTGVADAADADADATAPDTQAPPDATPITLPWEQATALRHHAGEATWAAALGGDVVLVADGQTWWWLDATGAREVAADIPLAAPPRAVLWGWPEGYALVATTEGLYLLAGGALGATPLAALIDGATVTSMASAGAHQAWLATGTDLWTVRGDLLAPLRPPLPSAAALLAHGAPVDGESALWVAAGGQVYGLTERGDQLLAWPEQPTLPAQAIAVDGAGALWLLSAGAVYRRGADALWEPLPLPAPVVHLAASAQSVHTWLAAEDGRLFHATPDAVTEIADPPAPGHHYAPSPRGGVLVAGPDGVLEVSPGRVLVLAGVLPGTLLEDARAVRARPSDPDEVLAVTAAVGASALPVTPPAAGAETPEWTVVLEPNDHPTGEHILEVTVTYVAGDEGEPELTAALPFRIRHATWDDDIAPLHERRCATCHDAVAGASTAVLDTPASWASRIDCLVCRVHAPFDPTLPECVACDDSASSMPPTGPIPGHEVDLIRSWRRSGFR